MTALERLTALRIGERVRVGVEGSVLEGEFRGWSDGEEGGLPGLPGYAWIYIPEARQPVLAHPERIRAHAQAEPPRTDGEHYAAIQEAVQALNTAIEAAKDAGLSIDLETLDCRAIGDPGRVDLVTAKVFRPIRGGS